MTQPSGGDLVVIVPCDDIRAAISVLLEGRRDGLGCAGVTHRIDRVANRDNGVRKAAEYLRVYQGSFRFALALLDLEGSGRECAGAQKTESEIEDSLRRSGWEDRSAVVCIDPELEAWIWSDPGVLARTLPAIRPSLTREDVERAAQANAPGPDEDHEDAFRRTLAQLNVRASSFVYGQLARKARLRTCTDRAFLRLRETLRAWFPREPRTGAPDPE